MASDGVSRVPVAELQPFPGNARRGDVGTIAESLQTLGQYRPIVVNRRDSTILAGNHTWLAAQRLGWHDIDVVYVDADEATARRINLVDNRANDLATYDIAALTSLLSEVDDLRGTGFSDDDLKALLAVDTPGELDFLPTEDTNRVDVSAERRCPQCGHVWREGPDGKIIDG